MSIGAVGEVLTTARAGFGANEETLGHAEVQEISNSAMSSINRMYRDCLRGALAEFSVCLDRENKAYTLCLLYYTGGVVGLGIAALVALP